METTKKAKKPFDNENNTPVVGKFYNIICAVYFNTMRGREIIYPIIGKLHQDPQFGLNVPHYHIDGRFAQKNQHINEKGETNSLLHTNENCTLERFIELRVCKLKCKRNTTGIIPRHAAYNRTDNIFGRWYKSMIGKSCAGKKCPHLGTTMQIVNGKLQCPLHKLQGCIDKEVIVEFQSN